MDSHAQTRGAMQIIASRYEDPCRAWDDNAAGKGRKERRRREVCEIRGEMIEDRRCSDSPAACESEIVDATGFPPLINSFPICLQLTPWTALETPPPRLLLLVTRRPPSLTYLVTPPLLVARVAPVNHWVPSERAQDGGERHRAPWVVGIGRRPPCLASGTFWPLSLFRPWLWPLRRETPAKPLLTSLGSYNGVCCRTSACAPPYLDDLPLPISPLLNT
jgi:hypothetical protein